MKGEFNVDKNANYETLIEFTDKETGETLLKFIVNNKKCNFNFNNHSSNSNGQHNYTFKEALKLLESSKLPADFDQWDLCDENGWSVAHEIADSNRSLPPNFNQWSIADKKGCTVAHVAAMYGRLPADFDQWDLADNDGWTVAHTAAQYDRLPPDFNQWDLTDKFGNTVAKEFNSHSLFYKKV